MPSVLSIGGVSDFSKRNILGEWAFHVFDIDGVETRVPCTMGEYQAYQGKDAVIPTHPNGKHLYSFTKYQYDTNDGFLGIGDYCDQGNFQAVNVFGKEIQLPIDSIVNGKVSAMGSQKFTERFPEK